MMLERRYGAVNPNWRAGRFVHRGYVYVYCPGHPFADKGGYVAEHRLVCEHTLGRMLVPGEVVHHKNGIRDDNRPGNLEVRTQSEHQRHHVRHIDQAKRRASLLATYRANGKRVVLCCPICGHEKEIRASRVRRGQRYCSRTCFGKAYSAMYGRNGLAPSKAAA